MGGCCRAMRGATVLTIKELAGHSSLSTTMRYMHLSPDHKEQAIRLLDQARNGSGLGDILETDHPTTGRLVVGAGAPTPETAKAPRD